MAQKNNPYGGKDVYGDAFALYRAKAAEFDKFVQFLVERLAVNGIDSSVFKDKVCLDAGCGSGRGSIFMLACGAKHVTGVDLSVQNVETSAQMARERGFANCTFQNGDVNALPFEDQQFDFVWCNGVLHHTPDTDKGLCEISRVLKVGGQMWLYLYGSGGIEWAIVDEIRDRFVKHVPYDNCLAVLQIIEDSIGSISEFLDNWYTPYLRRYTDADVQARLRELGFEESERLLRDVGNRIIDLKQCEFLGEQNLRYFLTKRSHQAAPTSRHVLPDVDGRGSAFAEGPEVSRLVKACQSAYDRLLELEKRDGRPNSFLRVAAARLLNGIILDELEQGAIRPEALDNGISRMTASFQMLTA